jgi:hypothetical protein
MKINIDVNTDEFKRAMGVAESQVKYAASRAINAVAEKGQKAVQAEMRKVFDRPTEWVVNSLRLKRSSKAQTKLEAEVAFKDRNSAESSRTMVEPHVVGGSRRFKAMEARLRGIGMLPAGWFVVPGAAAKLDANGNMSRGQISQVLNVLGSYTEAGFNKANINTVRRLAKGGLKSSQYGQFGFTYWVNPVGGKRSGRLLPGVYQRVQTGFGSSLKPVMVFVKSTSYKKRLDFYGIVQRTADASLSTEFTNAFNEAMRTARFSQQGSLL